MFNAFATMFDVSRELVHMAGACSHGRSSGSDGNEMLQGTLCRELSLDWNSYYSHRALYRSRIYRRLDLTVIHASQGPVVGLYAAEEKRPAADLDRTPDSQKENILYQVSAHPSSMCPACDMTKSLVVRGWPQEAEDATQRHCRPKAHHTHCLPRSPWLSHSKATPARM